MFRSFKDAEDFLRGVIEKTRKREIRWQFSTFGGFIQTGHRDLPAFYLFGEHPNTLYLRGHGEAYDVAISTDDNPSHQTSLEMLLGEITRQLGLLF